MTLVVPRCYSSLAIQDVFSPTEVLYPLPQVVSADQSANALAPQSLTGEVPASAVFDPRHVEFDRYRLRSHQLSRLATRVRLSVLTQKLTSTVQVLFLPRNLFSKERIVEFPLVVEGAKAMDEL
jgi:hypothetical protein